MVANGWTRRVRFATRRGVHQGAGLRMTKCNFRPLAPGPTYREKLQDATTISFRNFRFPEISDSNPRTHSCGGWKKSRPAKTGRKLAGPTTRPDPAHAPGTGLATARRVRTKNCPLRISSSGGGLQPADIADTAANTRRIAMHQETRIMGYGGYVIVLAMAVPTAAALLSLARNLM